MGTNNKNLERYLNLWNIFDNQLEKKGWNLSKFAKEWEKFKEIEEKNDYKIFYDKIKTQRRRKDNLKSVHAHSITQLEDYIKFLDSNFVIEEMRDDESYEHWFD